MQKEPSIQKIIFHDYLAYVSGTFPLMILVAFALFRITNFVDTYNSGLILWMIGLSMIGLIVFFFRLRYFQKLFWKGIVIKGKINHISFYRSRGRIDYVYTYRDQQYKSENYIHPTKAMRAFENGMQVDLILNPENPQRAYILDLYLKD